MARERVAIKPGWVNTELPESFYYDKDYLKIFAFFVLHAFRPNRSSKGRTMADYGWPKLDGTDLNSLYELCQIKENKKQIPHTSESYTYHWKYKGKDYPVVIAKESKGRYKVFSLLYEKLMKICLGSENQSDLDFIPPSDNNLIPSFIFLTGETLANLYYYDYETIFEQIEKSAVNKVTDEPLNNLALQFIRAYDICADQQLLEAAKLILRRIMGVFSDAIHCKVNLWQIECREKGMLCNASKEDARQTITEIERCVENDKEDYYKGMYFCLLVLLDEIGKAQVFFETQNDQLRDEIMKWPIYSFYQKKLNSSKTRDSKP